MQRYGEHLSENGGTEGFSKVPLLPCKTAYIGTQKCRFRNAKAALLKGVPHARRFAESERFHREGYVRAVVKRVVAFDEGLGGLEVADV